MEDAVLTKQEFGVNFGTTNIYDVFGVPRDATSIEIRKAYHALSLKYHPDRNVGMKMGIEMQLVNKIYAILKDPIKKDLYDAMGLFDTGAEKIAEFNWFRELVENGTWPGQVRVAITNFCHKDSVPSVWTPHYPITVPGHENLSELDLMFLDEIATNFIPVSEPDPLSVSKLISLEIDRLMMAYVYCYDPVSETYNLPNLPRCNNQIVIATETLKLLEETRSMLADGFDVTTFSDFIEDDEEFAIFSKSCCNYCLDVYENVKGTLSYFSNPSTFLNTSDDDDDDYDDDDESESEDSDAEFDYQY